MCLVDPNGDDGKDVNDCYNVDWSIEPDPLSGQKCIGSGEYIGDDLCEGYATWSTRTRYLSMMMLYHAENSLNDYVLFCDNYYNSLNYYGYPITGSLVLSNSYLDNNGACGNQPCMSKFFCVLINKEGDIRAVGGSINPDGNQRKNNLTILSNALQKNNLGCNIDATNTFKDCGRGLSYNGALDMFIYKGNKTSGSGITGSVADFITSLFDRLFGMYRSTFIGDTVATASLYQNAIPDFNRIYIANIGSRHIFAIEESFGSTDRLMANYTGFSTDICMSVNELVPGGGGNCTQTSTGYYVFANKAKSGSDEFFDSWQGITSSFRFKD
jgi:hypothetical protein